MDDEKRGDVEREQIHSAALADRDARTGAEQPWTPEDLAVAMGLDPTPENVARARRRLAVEGPSAIERAVP